MISLMPLVIASFEHAVISPAALGLSGGSRMLKMVLIEKLAGEGGWLVLGAILSLYPFPKVSK